MKHRSQPEHVRFAARLIVEAATDAFASGMCLTREAIKARAARPSTYLAGVVVETLSTYGATSQRFEYGSDAGAYVTTRMRAFERGRVLGAEVRGYIERPSREPGQVVRETLVHRRLVERPSGEAQWEEVATRLRLVSASEDASGDEGGES